MRTANLSGSDPIDFDRDAAMTRIRSGSTFTLTMLLALGACAESGDETGDAGTAQPDFTEAIRVDSGRATGLVMSAYTTTMIADGRDEARIRTFVTDSAGRRILSADNIIRLTVDGDATVARAADGHALERKTDEDGEYWETRLVDGVSEVFLRAGTTVDRIDVAVTSDTLGPSGHQIHTIPADVELLEPTADQIAALRAQARPADPMIGADISWLPELEARDVVFRDTTGEESDAVRILADHGHNAIRLRLFVNPENPEGYAPDEGFCGLDHTKRMARRIEDAGMGLLLDFHYSDYWADPQRQLKPGAWEDLPFDSLRVAMRDYTTRVLRELAAQGTPPAMVQIGNEINHGLLWPDGHISKLDNLADLLKSGVEGVRTADPDLPVMLHLALGGQNDEAAFWLDNMIARGVQFDVVGLSYYPRWHGTLPDLWANANDLVDRYGLPVNVVEYGGFAPEIHEVVFGLPDGMGQGTFSWEPLRRFFGEEDREPTQRLLQYDDFAGRYLLAGGSPE